MKAGLDLLDVVDVRSFTDPHVAAEPHALDVQAHLLVERAKFACRYWSRFPMSCQ